MNKVLNNNINALVKSRYYNPNLEQKEEDNRTSESILKSMIDDAIKLSLKIMMKYIHSLIFPILIFLNLLI